MASASSTSGRDPALACLVLASLALALLRFFRLGEFGLWFDEALTLSDAFHGDAFKNPLGYRLFGTFYGLLEHRPTEAQLRLPAAVLGALSIPLAAFAFRPIAGARAAWAVSLLMGASSWHVYWSQTARFYTLSLCLCLLGTGLFLRALRRGSAPLGLAGIAVAGLSVLAHPTSMFVVLPGLGFAGLIFWRGPRALRCEQLSAPRLIQLLIGLGLLGAALAVPRAYATLLQWQQAKGSGTPVHLILTSGFYFTPLLLAAALYGLVHLAQRRHPALQFAAVVVITGGALGLLASMVGRMTAQYLFVLLPYVMLLAVAPLVHAPELLSGSPPQNARRTPDSPTSLLSWGFLALLVLPSLGTVGLYFTKRQAERPPWREAYTAVHDQQRPGDLVLGMAPAVGEYYLDPFAVDLRRPDRVVYLDSFRHEEPLIWDRTGRRTWYVVNFERLADWEAEKRRELMRSLREDARQVARFPLYVESRDLSVYVFLRE